MFTWKLVISGYNGFTNSKIKVKWILRKKLKLSDGFEITPKI